MTGLEVCMVCALVLMWARAHTHTGAIGYIGMGVYIRGYLYVHPFLFMVCAGVHRA
jgi:hypothetical protein